MKLIQTDFGYFYPILVIAAKYIGGEFVQKYLAFSYYMKELESVVENGATHFKYKNETFPLTKEGVQDALKLGYGEKEEIIIDASAVEIKARYVSIYGEFSPGKKLLPTFTLNGKLYAIKDYTEKGKLVGDYVELTGGSKPYGEKTNGIPVPFYHETFSAGGGRVTAGVSGTMYVPLEVTAYRASRECLG